MAESCTQISIENLYRLPYSKNDNPNGWLEVTTYCNMRCPGCYRGCHLEESEKIHEPLEKLKKEIDLLLEIRNCQIISISGGEPLLHPNILEIIEYVSSLGLTPLLHTNGVLLTNEMLLKLKKAGLVSVHIRIDSLMQSKKTCSEQSLNKQRAMFSSLVEQVKDINLGFICVVSMENLFELPELINWFREDQSHGDFLTLIPVREVLFSENENTESSKWVTLDDLHSVLSKTLNEVVYSSYLGSQLQNKSIRWLQTSWVISGNKVISHLSGKSVEFFQMLTHFRTGRYSYLVKEGPNYISYLQILTLSIFLRDFRRIMRNLMVVTIKSPRLFFQKKRIQVISITIPPETYKGTVDLCDACPDAMLYNGELVPSCGLEEIKKFGSMLTQR